jgi:hypothetical protein
MRQERPAAYVRHRFGHALYRISKSRAQSASQNDGLHP